MDRLDGLLREHQGRDAFVLRCEMAAPWGLRVADRARLSAVIMIDGSLSLRFDGDPEDRSVSLVPGDVAVVRGDRDYLLADSADRAATAVIEPGQVCRALVAAGDPAPMSWRGRDWGNAAAGSTPSAVFLTGVYESRVQVSERLVEALPEVAMLPAPACDPALIGLLGAELQNDSPGQSAMLDRLVDLVLLTAVRAWFARPDVDPPRWWTAQRDPLVGPVLAMMHAQPGRSWTLADLADEAGWSKATLSRRFAELTGQSPMAYLTRWRLELAVDELRSGSDTVEAVARRVGYQNAFAFSAAFKRAYGQSPRAFRLAG